MNILYPVFALLALTLAVLIRMGLARYGAVKRREADGRGRGQAHWQAHVQSMMRLESLGNKLCCKTRSVLLGILIVLS